MYQVDKKSIESKLTRHNKAFYHILCSSSCSKAYCIPYIENMICAKSSNFIQSNNVFTQGFDKLKNFKQYKKAISSN